MNRRVSASALYMVIIISLVIGIVCAALIAGAFFYKLQYLKKDRYDRLENNLRSGINILLATDDTAFSIGKTLPLFNENADSVYLEKKIWGIFTVGISEAFDQKDTLYKTFSIANAIDSSKWAALYLADHDLPLSLGGNTSIKGTAYLSKAGIIEAFVDNKPYLGDKDLITGKKLIAARQLPALDSAAIKDLCSFLTSRLPADSTIKKDSIQASFLSPTKFVRFGKKVTVLKNCSLAGNIVIQSDTTIEIDSTAHLNNIIIFSKVIDFKTGFKGKGQFFAQDTIHVAGNCTFLYPSVLALIGTSTDQNLVRRLSIDSTSDFSGTIFTWQKIKSDIGPIIEIGKKVKISGQVYAQSAIKFNDASYISGSVFTTEVLYKKSLTFYRGYLVDADIDSHRLSNYYLTSHFLPVSTNQRMILQWLESN